VKNKSTPKKVNGKEVAKEEIFYDFLFDFRGKGGNLLSRLMIGGMNV